MQTKLTLLLLLIGTTTFGQKANKENTLVDRRDQAQGWYLPIKGKVTQSGSKAKNFKIEVFEDNKSLGEIKATGQGEFGLELDIDNYYAVRISKEGYLDKLVYFDTHLPKEQVTYPSYVCNVNLEPADKFRHSDPFFLDFPSAIVRWNDELKGFIHSESYLSDIQVKMAMLEAQVEP